MKILVLENGQQGRIEDIPGENVTAGLGELLGGEVYWEKLTRHLQLVTRKDGHKEALPVHYTRYQPGCLPALIFGNAVVVRVDQSGKAHNLTRDDAEEVNLYLHLAEG